jgi:CRP-like cAMP-binding protein
LAQTDVSQLHGASGSSKIIAELQAAGTGMGQRALASNSLRTATIVALEESEVRRSQ